MIGAVPILAGLTLLAAPLAPPELRHDHTDIYLLGMGESQLISPLLNDPDPGLPFRLAAYSGPGHGVIDDVDWQAGTFVYTPDLDFYGIDYLIYTAWVDELELGWAGYVILWVREFPGDINEDGFVGQDDLDIVLADWGLSHVPPPAMPEPSAITLLALGACLIFRRRVLSQWGQRE